MTRQVSRGFCRPLSGWREAAAREPFLASAIERLAGHADHPLCAGRDYTTTRRSACRTAVLRARTDIRAGHGM